MSTDHSLDDDQAGGSPYGDGDPRRDLERSAVDALYQLLDLHADLEHHYRATAHLWDRLTRRQDRHLLDPRWQDMRGFTRDLDDSVEALDDAEVELLAAWADLSVGLARGAMLAAVSATAGVEPDRTLVLDTASEDADLNRVVRQLGEFDATKVGTLLGREQREAVYLEELREAAAEALAGAHRATPDSSLGGAARENLVSEVTESCEALGDLAGALMILLSRR